MPSMGTWLSPYLHVFTNLAVSRDYSRVIVWASHCGGSSCCRTWSRVHGLSCCGTQVSCLQYVESSGPGTEPVSPALAGRFLTTGPPGKSPFGVLWSLHYIAMTDEIIGHWQLIQPLTSLPSP